jgi:hypothetical protein
MRRGRSALVRNYDGVRRREARSAVMRALLVFVAAVSATALLVSGIQAARSTLTASVQVEPGLNVARVNWQAPSGSKVLLDLGATAQYGLSLGPRNPTGSLLIRSLAPGTTYYYRLSIVGRRGAIASGSFATDAVGSSATLMRSGASVLLNGAPYLPVMAYANACQASPELVAGALSLGAAILDDQPLFSKTAGDYINSCRDPSMISSLEATLAGRAWYYSDIASVREALSAVPGVFGTSAGIERTLNDSSIGRKCNGGETSACYFNSLAAAASSHPVVVTSVVREGQAFPKVHNDVVNFEFWEGIAAGAVGVDYFARGSNGTFMVANQSVVALARLNGAKLATLEPAIGGGVRQRVHVSGTTAVETGAWSYNGATYVVAVNVSRAPQAATLEASGVSATRVDALWEARSVRMEGRAFGDRFEPLGIHIYRLT